MSEPDLFDELRRLGFDADDAQVRRAVRVAVEQIELVRAEGGEDAGRRCLQAMQAALAYQFRHPDTDDMSSFESDYDQWS